MITLDGSRWACSLMLMMLLSAGVLGGEGHAAEATTARTTDDPSCVMKRPSDLCALSDGGGGTCVPTRCASGQPCLRCVAAPLNSPETRSYTMFIVIGVLIFAGGMVFVFRLRKNWK